ncbi:hypothetical protein K502DRAFT_61269 [Neoconidiobolus thromboides FSU 785]|nr:hypothetical protein K502DRAFT_61269 [Neoconidiobolus thromboides FSU 785]
MSTSAFLLYEHRSKIVNHFSNGVSTIFCTIALLLALTLRVVNKKLNKSISFRLSIFILIGDLLFSIFQIMAVHSTSDFMCHIATAGFLFATLISLLYTVSVALNLVLTIIFKIYCGQYMKLALYIVPFLISLIVSILPLAFKQISFRTASCWFREEEPEGLNWAYATNYIWIMITIVFCTMVFLSVTFYLIIQRSIFRSSYQGMETDKLEIKTQTIIKLLMYPLTPIICYTLIMVKLILISRGVVLEPEADYSLNITATFFKGFQGFFNASIFLSNSLLYKEAELAFKKLKRGQFSV